MRRELRAAAERYRLAVPRRAVTGRIGERLGRGLGASVEFEDHRDYQPGDDPRHVDWRAYARTERLAVRLYREEVAPTLDVVVDRSPQMAVTPAKRQAACDMVDALSLWGAAEGGGVHFLSAGGERFEPARELAFDQPFSGFRPRAALRSRGLRVVLSDFLRPDDPNKSLASLAAGCAHLFVIQVLDPWELQPEVAGPSTLLDADRPGELAVDVPLDKRSIAAYQTRLRRLIDSVADATRRFGGSHALVTAGDPQAMCGRDLLRAGVVQPA